MQVQLDHINFLKNQLQLPIIKKYLPFDLIEEYKNISPKSYRDRIYSLEVTLQTMLFQAMNEDKSDQNAVVFIYDYYKSLKQQISATESRLSLEYSKKKKVKGRPRKKHIQVQKSKTREISVNTASYNEAKKRLPMDLIQQIAYSLTPPDEEKNLWKGRKVYIVDGTNLDTVDTPELRNYYMPKGINTKASLPIVKIGGLIELYSGLIVNLEMDNFSSSESRILKKMYPRIPSGTVILGDDLYSSYSHMAYCRSQGCDMISQGKHRRKDKVIKEITANDNIIEWTADKKRPAWYSQEDSLPKHIRIRRISYTNPRSPAYKVNLYTTLLDENKYSANDIIALYASRWDIEIGFREIKTIMKMEHLRSKTVDMVRKEVYAHWIAYNMIRTIMYEATVTDNDNFFSLGEELQTMYSMYKNENYMLDSLGRSYKRRSPGRYPQVNAKKKKKEKIKQN